MFLNDTHYKQHFKGHTTKCVNKILYCSIISGFIGMLEIEKSVSTNEIRSHSTTLTLQFNTKVI